MKCQAPTCQEENWSNSNFCILHTDFPDDETLPIFEVLKREKAKKLKDKLDRNDFDFSDAKLFEIDVSNMEINDKLNFFQATIINGINVEKSTIKGEMNFIGATIPKNTNCNNVEVHGDVRLAGTNLGSVDFSNSKIKGRVVVIMDSIIENYFNFKDVTIEKGMTIYKSTFNGECNFNHAKIKEDFFIGKSNFNEEVSFGQVKFFENATFKDGVEFFKKVTFNYAMFNGVATFKQKESDFDMFKNLVYFINSSFLSRGIFEGLYKFDTSFEGARLKNVAFRNCNLFNVRFKDVTFDNCELSSSELPDKIIEHKEHEYSKELDFNKTKLSIKMTTFENTYSNRQLPLFSLTIIAFRDKVINAKMVADTYRRIKQCLENQGAYIEASEFYKKEMDMRKEVYWSENKVNWLFYSLLSSISRYGENSKRLAVLIASYYVILLAMVSIFNISPSNPYLVYFNIFIIPIGSFLMALFVYVFARKMSR